MPLLLRVLCKLTLFVDHILQIQLTLLQGARFTTCRRHAARCSGGCDSFSHGSCLYCSTWNLTAVAAAAASSCSPVSAPVVHPTAAPRPRETRATAQTPRRLLVRPPLPQPAATYNGGHSTTAHGGTGVLAFALPPAAPTTPTPLPSATYCASNSVKQPQPTPNQQQTSKSHIPK